MWSDVETDQDFLNFRVMANLELRPSVLGRLGL